MRKREIFMEVLKYFRSLYFGKDALGKHVTLFSIIGLTFLLLNNVVSFFAGNAFVFNLLVSAPVNRLEVIIEFFFGLLFFIYLVGYFFLFLKKGFVDKRFELVDFSREAFSLIVRILPLFLVWNLYYAVIIFVIGTIILAWYSHLSYIALAVLVCSFPFVNLLFVRFAKTFEYKKEFFNILTIFKLIDKTFVRMLFLTVDVLFMFAISLVLVYLCFWATNNISSEIIKLILKLSVLSVCGYLHYVLMLVYGAGMVEISEETTLE